jgi:hypothetical protein
MVSDMTITHIQPEAALLVVPEYEALDLVAGVASDLFGQHAEVGRVFRDLAHALAAEGAFAGMSRHDAAHAASAIVFDTVSRPDPAAFLLHRAAGARAGTDGVPWDAPEAVVRAFKIGARLVAL